MGLYLRENFGFFQFAVQSISIFNCSKCIFIRCLIKYPFIGGIVKLKTILLILLFSNTMATTASAEECANIYKEDFWLGVTMQDVQRCVFNAGVDVNTPDKFGITQLQLAINYAADSSIVQALVDAGADVNAVNKFGQTPLRYTVNTFSYYGDIETIKILLNAGADQNLLFHRGGTYLHQFFWVYHFEDAEILQVIIDATEDINALDDNGKTALDVAIRRGRYTQIIFLLEEAGSVRTH